MGNKGASYWELELMEVHRKKPLSGVRLAYGPISSNSVSTYYRTSIVVWLLEVDRREQSILSTLDTHFTVALVPTPLPDGQKEGSNDQIRATSSAVSFATPTERLTSLLL